MKESVKEPLESLKESLNEPLKEHAAFARDALRVAIGISAVGAWVAFALLFLSAWGNRNLLLIPLMALTAVMLTVSAFVLERRLYRPLNTLTDVVSNWDNAEPDEQFQQLGEIPGPIGELGKRLHGQMVELEEHLADLEEKTREETTRDVRAKIAERISKSILPMELKDYPSRQYFSVAGQIHPGKQEYGLFYDYFFVDPGLVCVAVGQVPYSGVDSAVFVSVIEFTIRARLRMGRSLAETLSDVNTQIFDYGARSDACALVGTLDTGMGYFSYVNAGLCAPMLMRNGERFEKVDFPALTPLGKDRNVTYRADKLRLRQGDRLFLFTDGLDQAKNQDGDAFGEQKLRETLNLSRSRKQAEDSLTYLADEAAAFCTSDDEHSGYAALMLEYLKGEKELAHCRVPGAPGYEEEMLTFLKSQFDENGIHRKSYARIAVLAEELFSLCCRTLEKEGDDLTVECGVSPDAESVTIRISGQFGGKNPIQEAQASDSNPAAEFIQNHGDYVRFKSGEEYDSVSVVCFI